MNDLAVRARDNEFARASVKVFRQVFIERQIIFENCGFKVGNFFEKMTLLAVVIRIVKRKPPFVTTGDKGEMSLNIA